MMDLITEMPKQMTGFDVLNLRFPLQSLTVRIRSHWETLVVSKEIEVLFQWTSLCLQKNQVSVSFQYSCYFLNNQNAGK